MPDAIAFLSKAEESLASAEADFAAERYNACARNSYYAVFQVAVAALMHERMFPGGAWSHKFVITRFSGILVGRRKLFPSTWRPAVSAIQELRLKADYSESSTSERAARRSLLQSREIVRIVRERIDGNR